MIRLLLLILFGVAITGGIFAQTSLTGKVTDQEDGAPIILGNVAIYKNGVLITGTETDVDGNFNFPDIDPGTYDVEASYTGYTPQRVEGVTVLAGKANTVDLQLQSGLLLDVGVEVVDYKVPLIEQDNTTSGSVITADQIKNLPTRNINALAATSAGLSSSDEGNAITVRGSRSNATDYYVDGIRVLGGLVPDSEIEQLQVITGGIEAQYGDVTGGIISITTKGPSNKFSGGVEMETSSFFDPYDQSLIGLNLSGPILRNKQGQSVLGYRFSGRYTYQADDDPPGIPVYRIKDDKLAELEANPILDIGGNPFVAADFLTNDDVNEVQAKPFETSSGINLNAKIDARLSDAIDITLTGIYLDNENQFTPGGWRVLNSQNNPTDHNTTYRGNFRFRHRLGGGNDGLIQNASYTLQFGYEHGEGELNDDRFGRNYFEYGHVGDFDIEWVPTFTPEFDPETQSFLLRHTDYREVLRGYEGAMTNPVVANYNNALGLIPGEGINSQIPDYIISTNFNTGAVFSLDDFIAPNGRISSVYNNAWGFHQNVGWVFNQSRFDERDLYTFSGRANFDLVPGGSSDKGRHNIQLGFLYEQRINRVYSVAPRDLWLVGRQQVNNHIQGIEAGADTIGFIDIPGAPNTPLLEVSIVEDSDSRFYRSVREMLGVPLSEYVNIDGLSPDQLSLDLFSARELNDQNLLTYLGYDYLGNEFNGTFDEFFTTVDDEGVRAFPVAPNRPIYTAAYIQDKFTFRDIIFRLGVRVDRYDANTRVLKDPYSLYEIMDAGEYHSTVTDDEQPGSIGDEFKVYVDETGNAVQAYRDGDDWFRDNGTPVNSPVEIFSGGLVFPYYQDERVREDPNFIKSPDFDPGVSFEDYEPQVNVMPRLAFSFPISQNANFFAHYDVLVQRPPSNTIATALDYFYFTDRPGDLKNNPDLRPERTIDYEIGFQQKLTNASKLKIAAYYKELRDMIQQRIYFPVPVIGQYTTYDNQDFGTVKGFSFEYELRRTQNVSLTANYTLQFADGTGSNANSQQGLVNRGNLRTLFPLNFDERHRINLLFDYRYGGGPRYNGPRLFGADIFANAGLNLQTIAVSGRPYTQTEQPLELGGAQTIGSINGARLPWTFTLNLQVDKSFIITPGLNMNLYCRISNLLDRRNVVNVYSATGSPTDDGFLASSNGQDKIESIENSTREVESYLAAYQWARLNPNNFALPRRIYVGAIFDF